MRKKIISTRKFIKPSFRYLIEKKRDGGEFSDDEIRYLVDSILDEEIPDYQQSAFAMAIYFQNTVRVTLPESGMSNLSHSGLKYRRRML